MRSGHYAVVLSKNAKHSAWLLFILTHELGHIVQGHVSRDGVLVDELVDRSSRDKEEKAANAFALELLTGTPELRVLPTGPGRSARALARAALDAGVHEQIDPGHIVLNCAYQMGGDFFALANAALAQLEPHADAVAIVRSRMFVHLDKTKLPKDTYDFILRVTRAGQRAVICLVDNDVIYKLAMCNLLDDSLAALDLARTDAYVLPTAKYKFGVTRKRAARGATVWG